MNKRSRDDFEDKKHALESLIDDIIAKKIKNGNLASSTGISHSATEEENDTEKGKKNKKKGTVSPEELIESFNTILGDFVDEEGFELIYDQGELWKFRGFLSYPNYLVKKIADEKTEIDRIMSIPGVINAENNIAIDEEGTGSRKNEFIIHYTRNHGLALILGENDNKFSTELMNRLPDARTPEKEGESLFRQVASFFELQTEEGKKSLKMDEREHVNGVIIREFTICVKDFKYHQMKRFLSHLDQKLQSVRWGPHPILDSECIVIEVFANRGNSGNGGKG